MTNTDSDTGNRSAIRDILQQQDNIGAGTTPNTIDRRAERCQITEKYANYSTRGHGMRNGGNAKIEGRTNPSLPTVYCNSMENMSQSL